MAFFVEILSYYRSLVASTTTPDASHRPFTPHIQPCYRRTTRII
jgi:hypothetical protein